MCMTVANEATGSPHPTLTRINLPFDVDSIEKEVIQREVSSVKSFEVRAREASSLPD